MCFSVVTMYLYYVDCSLLWCSCELYNYFNTLCDIFQFLLHDDCDEGYGIDDAVANLLLLFVNSKVLVVSGKLAERLLHSQLWG